MDNQKVTDIAPTTERHKKRRYEQDNDALKEKVTSLESEVLHYQQQVEKLTTGSIPQLVKNWMHEYSLPWELFWCYEHSEWLTEIDTCFPFHTEQSTCQKCHS